MSLQVQSSQQPPSGRRTPQIYQNFGTGAGTTTTSPTNGNSKPSKLSLKAAAASEKASAATPATTESTAAGVKESQQTLVVSIAKLADEAGSSPKAAAVNDDTGKPAATNGSSANGTHNEKATNGKTEETTATPTKTVSEPQKKEDEKEKKVKQSPRATPQKQAQSEPESTPSKDSSGKKAKEPSSPVTPDQKKKEKPSVGESSLVAEKALKGFTAEGEEMESLIVEPSEYEDSPMPPRTGGKSKLLKYGGGPLARARISPFRVNEATKNVSTVINLSPVNEGQTSVSESNEASPVVDYNRSLRTISGRRSTRPLTDIQLTYRRSADLNDSTSSLNVTIGSEIHNDSLRTPAPGSSRKRKAMTPESTSDALDVKEIVDSPKRGRLDFSGLLGIVASPVTMLKNRFSRVKLQASTPVANRNFVEENLNPGEIVTAEATTTTANISGEDAKMEVETGEEQKTEDLAKTTTGDGGEENAEQHATVDDNNASTVPESKDDGSGDGNDPVEVKDVTNKRQFCIIM